MSITEEQELAQHAGVKGPMDRIRQKRKGERAYTNEEIARFESLRAELRAFDDPAQIDRMEKAVAVLRGGAQQAGQPRPSADTGGQWQLQHSVPSDGFECFYILKNGLQIAEVSGPQNVENTTNLQELVNAANAGRPADDPLADLVARFSAAMLGKLRAAEKKYGWTDAWMQADWQESCQRQFAEHVQKGDPRDVANYCAFMWHHGWSTGIPGPPQAPTEHSPVSEGHPRMVEALEFYADSSRYDGPNLSLRGEPDKYQPEGLVYRLDVTRDHGKIARAALTAARDTEGKGETWDIRIFDRVQQLRAAGTESLTLDAVLGLIAFVRDGEGCATVSSTQRANGT